MGNFRSLRKEFIFDHDEKAENCEDFGAIYAIGWIPYFRHTSEIPGSSAFKTHRLATPSHKYFPVSPFTMLFRTGNHFGPGAEARPPASLRKGGFAAFARTKNYRVLKGIDDLKVWFSARGTPVKASFDWTPVIGYTPLPGGFSKGEGSWDTDAICTDGTVKIRWDIQFKVGPAVEFLAEHATGFLAPFANLRIDFVLPPGEPPSVRFTGSLIPSLALYLDGNSYFYHDMTRITEDQIDQFITAQWVRAPHGVLYEHRPGRADGKRSGQNQ